MSGHGSGLEGFGLLFKRSEPLDLTFHLLLSLVFLLGLVLELLDNDQELVNLVFGLLNMVVFLLVDLLDFSLVMDDITVFGAELLFELLYVVGQLLLIMKQFGNQLHILIEHTFHLLFLFGKPVLELFF